MARFLHSIECRSCGKRWRLIEPWPVGESTANYISQVMDGHTECPDGLFKINEIERKDTWLTTASDTPAASPETI